MWRVVRSQDNSDWKKQGAYLVWSPSHSRVSSKSVILRSNRVRSYGPLRYCMVFSCSVDLLLGGSTSRCGKCFLGLDIKNPWIYIFFSWSQHCSCCRHFFFVCKDLGSLIVTMNYFQMYHFYKELKEVLFFFFLLAFEKQKKNLTTTTEFY